MVIETERGVLDTIRGLGGFLGTARVVSEGMESIKDYLKCPRYYV